jgi:hypothetical protein
MQSGIGEIPFSIDFSRSWVKGTGFSPYIEAGIDWASAPEGDVLHGFTFPQRLKPE